MNRITARLSALGLVLSLCAAGANALTQRPRVVDNNSNAPAAPSATPATTAPAPQSVKVKYEGGMVGYRKADGFLAFDDANRRLVFQDKTRREVFSLPFDAMLALWPDTKSQTSTAGRVVSIAAPFPFGLSGLLMKSKTRYLVIQYKDQDTGAGGLTSFKIGNKALLASVLQTLGRKAEMTPRGEAYVRPKDATAKSTDKTGGPE
jgi:hypothetical protein